MTDAACLTNLTDHFAGYFGSWSASTFRSVVKQGNIGQSVYWSRRVLPSSRSSLSTELFIRQLSISNTIDKYSVDNQADWIESAILTAQVRDPPFRCQVYSFGRASRHDCAA